MNLIGETWRSICGGGIVGHPDGTRGFVNLPEDILLAVIAEWVGVVVDASSIDVAWTSKYSRTRWLSLLSHPFCRFHSLKIACEPVSGIDVLRWLERRNASLHALPMSEVLVHRANGSINTLRLPKIQSIALKAFTHEFPLERDTLYRFFLSFPKANELIVEINAVSVVPLVQVSMAEVLVGACRAALPLQHLVLRCIRPFGCNVASIIAIRFNKLRSLELHSPILFESLRLIGAVSLTLSKLAVDVCLLSVDQVGHVCRTFTALTILHLEDSRNSVNELNDALLARITESGRSWVEVVFQNLRNQWLSIRGPCLLLSRNPQLQMLSVRGFLYEALATVGGSVTRVLQTTMVVAHKDMEALLASVPRPLDSLCIGTHLCGSSELWAVQDCCMRGMLREVDLVVNHNVAEDELVAFITACLPVTASIRIARAEVDQREEDWLVPIFCLNHLVPTIAVYLLMMWGGVVCISLFVITAMWGGPAKAA